MLFHKKPKGFNKYTELRAKKELESYGYITKIARNPYTKKGEKVLFYRIRKLKNPKKSIKDILDENRTLKVPRIKVPKLF